MESIDERASNHLHFLGDALHVQSVRHFFFVDLESVGGVVHKELYRLLYGRVCVAHESPAAILLFRRSSDKEKEKQKAATTKRFEERCGHCKKAITTNIYFDTNNNNNHNHSHNHNNNRNSAETPTAADQRRIWVPAAASPAHMISFAAAFLVEQALALPGGDTASDPNATAASAPLSVYLVSNDAAATKQLARQLKARVRLAQAVADGSSSETAKEEGKDDDGDDEDKPERVRFHRLRVDRAGVWAKPKGVECLREAGLLAQARVAAADDVADRAEKKARPAGWEVVNPFAFFALEPKNEAERRTTATTAAEAKGRWKEKDLEVVVRRAKYHLWAEHERGIVLPRTLHDLRKKVRGMCVLEKRLDPGAVLALLERSRLIDVCPICHDFDYSFDRYNAARSESKKKRAKPTAITVSDDGKTTTIKSESDTARAQRRKKSGAMDRHSKEERIKRVAKAVTLKLLKVKREDRPKGRQALLDFIDAGHASYKTRIDAELVLARLTACRFVSTPNRTTGGAERGQSGAAAALGREDISVEYDLGALDDDERQRSADESAAQKARKAAADAEAEAELEADGRNARNASEREEEEVVYAPAWTWANGDEAAASEDQLAEQRRLIGLAAGRRPGKGDKGAGAEAQGAGVGTYMAYLAEQLRVAGRSADSIGDIDSCGLSDEVLRGFYSYGFEKPTVLQRKGIANIMAKRGSGKTAAYVVPLLQSLDRHLYSPQAIVLAPTRPLAQQIEGVISCVGEYLGVQCALVCGGGSVSQCMQALKRCHVVVATGGRLYDMIQRKALELDHVQLFVVDEIDDMLSTTKKDQLYDIFKMMPSTVQVVTVDTVLSEEAFAMHLRFMRELMAIASDGAGAGVFPPGVDQYALDVEAEEHKLATLVDLLGGSPPEPCSDLPRLRGGGGGENWDEARWSEAGDATAVAESPQSEPDADGGAGAGRLPPPPPPSAIEGIAQVVVFCNSKRKVDWLTDRLMASNITVLAIHEYMEHTSVQAGLRSFRAGSSRILITTDSLSFGLDVQQLNLVINYDVPKSAPGMVRRVGRAGRFSRKGAAITLLAGHDDRRLLEALQAAIPFRAPPLPASLVLRA